MPLYVGDYLGDTGHLTTTQHGAYLLLMMHYWRKGELPDDDKQLSKITKLPFKTWCEYRPTLQDFFHEGWKHKRIDAELAKMMRVSEQRAMAGQKGGIGSALARMKLENAACSRSVPSRAIAVQSSSQPAANVDHSHSHQSFLRRGRAMRLHPASRNHARKNPRFPSVRSWRPMSPNERRNEQASHDRTTNLQFRFHHHERQSDMARVKRNKQQRLAKVHDRRSTDLPRNAEVAAVEVDDPLALKPGEKIVTLRSLRNDPLARLHSIARSMRAVSRVGGIQDDWKRPSAAPGVDRRVTMSMAGGAGLITERQRKAVLRLIRAERELGADGSALVHVS